MPRREIRLSRGSSFSSEDDAGTSGLGAAIDSSIATTGLHQGWRVKKRLQVIVITGEVAGLTRTVIQVQRARRA